MDVLEILEAQAFNELVSFEFEDVRKLFNYYAYYVDEDKLESFVKEATVVKKTYAEEMKQIDAHNNKNSGLYEDDPIYKTNKLLGETKINLIKLIKKYFSQKAYDLNKHDIKKEWLFKDEVKENHERLTIIFQKNLRFVRAIYFMILHYKIELRAFIKYSDMNKMCDLYNKELIKMNPSLAGQYWCPFYSCGYFIKSSGYICPDKYSMFELIIPYLKSNTNELADMIEILCNYMRKYHSETTYSEALCEVQEYVENYELKKGGFKRLD